jgi:hypothetical protein
MATAAISGDVLYLRGRKHVFAIAAKWAAVFMMSTLARPCEDAGH